MVVVVVVVVTIYSLALYKGQVNPLPTVYFFPAHKHFLEYFYGSQSCIT